MPATIRRMPLDAPLLPPSVPTRDAEVAIHPLVLGREQRRAWVFDHVIEVAALQLVYDDVRRRAFTFDNTDSDATVFARHMTHSVLLEDISDDRVVASLVATARSLAWEVGLPVERLERVYANLSLFGDHQHAHTDGDVWTVLFFLNASWHTDWGGELHLFDDDDATVAYAVAPRPGRAVLFDGELGHRAGVPSKYCPDGRITLAVKFHKP